MRGLGGGSRGAGEGADGVGLTSWSFGAHYEAADIGRGMEPHGSPINGGPVLIPGFASIAVIRAPFDLTIQRLVVASNAGANDTEFGIYFGLGSGVKQGASLFYANGNTWLDEPLSLAVPAGTFVGLRWIAGTLPQFTGSQAYWV